MKLFIDTINEDNQIQVITEAVSTGGKNYFIEGVFAQAEKKNRNGRVYPKGILEKAIADFEPMVKARRALGELNHPACYLYDDFDVLTNEGWKPFIDLKIGECVLSMNEDKKFVESEIVDITNEEYDGECYHIVGRNIDSTVTPNHRFYILDRFGNVIVKTAKELHDNQTECRKQRIVKVVNYQPTNDTDVVVIPGIDESEIDNNGARYNNDVTKDLHIPTEVFVKFLGFWLAEGWISKEKYIVHVCQNEGDVLDEVRRVWNQLPFTINETSHCRPNGQVHVALSFSDRRLHAFLSGLGRCHEKFIPSSIKKLKPSYLETLIEWFAKGDGRKVINGRNDIKGKMHNVFSTSKTLIDDLQECLIKAGMHGNITTVVTTKDYIFGGHEIKAENKRPLYVLNISRTSGIWLDTRHKFSIVKKTKAGKACCITTKHENFYIRDNGKTYLTGNSPSINPERASHLITKLEWKDNDVSGRSKILTSLPMGKIAQGLIDEKVSFGISTRGLGTVTESKDAKIVQDNYKIVTFDLVSDPSGIDCWVNGIMENAEWIYDVKTGSWIIAEEVKKEISAMSRKTLVEEKARLFEKFLNSIR